MSRDIKIADSLIGGKHPPFIVAEMSGNHNRSIDRALKIAEAAALSGVNALKLQTYTADTMTLNIKKDEFYIDDSESLWKGKSLYALYEEAFTPWEWHARIFERCRELGLIAFSTPFDETAVDFLEGLDVPAYKIASFENNHLPLIKKVATTGKPLILSTGMASVAELDDAVRIAKKYGCRDIILLKCTSSYPSDPLAANLRTIPHLKEMFDLEVGVSDHTPGIGVSIASVSLGAIMIERHFTLSRSDNGVDSVFSLEPSEMKMLCQESFRAWQALGKVHYGPTEKEKSSTRFKRSLYISKDLQRGDLITPESIRVIRPGNGLPPKYYDLVMGKRISRDVKKGTPLSMEDIN